MTGRTPVRNASLPLSWPTPEIDTRAPSVSRPTEFFLVRASAFSAFWFAKKRFFQAKHLHRTTLFCQTICLI